MCCHTDNHGDSLQNYAVGDGEELACYDWCCEEVEIFCNGICNPEGSNLGTGNSYTSPPQSGDEYGGVGNGPQVCCTLNECCADEPGTIWPVHMSPDTPFCCFPDEVLNEDDKVCCCENEDTVCCPNLDLHC